MPSMDRMTQRYYNLGNFRKPPVFSCKGKTNLFESNRCLTVMSRAALLDISSSQEVAPCSRELISSLNISDGAGMQRVCFKAIGTGINAAVCFWQNTNTQWDRLVQVILQVHKL